MIHIYPYKRFIWVYTPFRGAYDIYLLKKYVYILIKGLFMSFLSCHEDLIVHDKELWFLYFLSLIKNFYQ